MASETNQLTLYTLTLRPKGKHKIVVIHDSNILKVLRDFGVPMDVTSHVVAPRVKGQCQGIYFLPTNQVIEVFATENAGLVGYLFDSLDAWLTEPSHAELKNPQLPKREAGST